MRDEGSRDVTASLREGDRVRFSAAGRAKVQSMPEAWGLHRALLEEEEGEIVESSPPEAETPAQVCVDFPSGSAFSWDADCFELLET
jgi:hypothetical protein